MPSDAERAVLYDILHNLDLVQQFIQDRDYERFRVDTLRVYAVTRCLEIISEASRRLSEELKARHSDIAWHEMAGAGNVYRHDYEDVSVQRLWDTVQLALPPLRAVVMAEISGLPPEDA